MSKAKSWLTRLTIGQKCLGLTVFNVLLLLAVAGTGVWGIHRISADAEQLLKREAKIAEQSAAAQTGVLELRRFEKDIFLNCADPRKVEEYSEKFRNAQISLTSHLETLKGLASTD